MFPKSRLFVANQILSLFVKRYERAYAGSCISRSHKVIESDTVVRAMHQVNGGGSFSATWGPKPLNRFIWKLACLITSQTSTPHAKYGGRRKCGCVVRRLVNLYHRKLVFGVSLIVDSWTFVLGCQRQSTFSVFSALSNEVSPYGTYDFLLVIREKRRFPSKTQIFLKPCT